MSSKVARDAVKLDAVRFEYRLGSVDRHAARVYLRMVTTFSLVAGILIAVQGSWRIGLLIAVLQVIPVWAGGRWSRRVCIRAYDEYLVVVNMSYTHRLSRADIAAFRITPSDTSKLQHLEIVRPDYSTIDCDVTRPPRFPAGRTKPDLISCKEALDDWLHAAPAATTGTGPST